MKTYLIEIGNMNAQNRYKIKASSSKSAIATAIKTHKEYGRKFDPETMRARIVLAY